MKIEIFEIGCVSSMPLGEAKITLTGTPSNPWDFKKFAYNLAIRKAVEYNTPLAVYVDGELFVKITDKKNSNKALSC